MTAKPGHGIKQGLRSLFLMHFLGKIIRLFKSSSYNAVKFVFANTDFTHLLNLYKFKTQYPLAKGDIGIIACWGIGDTLIAAGLAHELVKHKIADRVVLLVKPAHQFIAELFPSVSKVYLLDANIDYLDRPLNYLKLPPQHLKAGQYYYAHFFNHDLFELIGYQNITMLDAYRAIFKLNKQATLEKPLTPTQAGLDAASALLNRYGLEANKTILLATGANSIPLIKKEFWLNLCRQLTGRGYTVLLNSQGVEYLISDRILYIDIPLQQIVPLAMLVSNVISIRSGLCDLLSLYQVNLIVIYPKIRWMGGNLIEGAGIKAMWPAPQLTELEMELPKSTDVAPDDAIYQDKFVADILNALV